MLKLFHISEKGDIDEFIPRKSKQIWEYKEYVWAISEAMVHNYIFPRDCPRICVGNEVITHLSDWVDKEEISDKKALIFIPTSWEEQFKSCTIYRYELDASNFKLIDSIAGYYVSEVIEKSIEINKIADCHKQLQLMNVEVLMKPVIELKEIRQKIIQITNNFSIIRWSNLISSEKNEK